MKIKDGQEFLEKLENLAPDLVADAGREYDRAAEKRARRQGPGIGTWIAVAACLCVLCLPVILRQAIGSGGNTEGIITAGGADTSHQLPDEGMTEGGAAAEDAAIDGTAGGPAETAKEALPEGFSVEEIALGDGASYRRTVLAEEYVDCFAYGMPASEYFQYNNQNPENEILWGDQLESGLGANYSLYPWDFPQLRDGILTIEGYKASHVFLQFETRNADLPHRLALQWEPEEEQGGTAAGYIIVSVLEQDYFTLDEQESLREYIIQNHETVVMRDGVEVTALGGIGTSKTLSFWRDGRFYRVYAQAAPPETMVQLLDWLLEDFELGDFDKEKVAAIVTLQDYPDAFAGYYPTDSRFVCKAGFADIELVGSAPAALVMVYDYEATPLITSWIIASEDSDFWTASSGSIVFDLPDITREQLRGIHEANLEVRALSNLPEANIKNFGSLPLEFYWDGYHVTLYYKPVENVEDELWALIEYLRSDEVKIERKIGDIVDLQPYD